MKTKIRVWLLGFFLQGCGDEMGYTIPINDAEPLEGRPETIIGNSIENLAPAPVFPGYGPDFKLLYLPDPNSQRGQGMVLYIESRPILRDGLFFNGGPIVGRLRIGSGGGGAEFEFDIQSPRRFTISGVDGLTSLDGPASYRYGITAVPLRAAFFQLDIRNDGRMRTAHPSGAPGNQLGGNPNDLDFPVENVAVSAWIAYGQKTNFPKIVRSIWVSNGVASQLGVGVSITIVVPSGSRKVRIPRNPGEAIEVAQVINLGTDLSIQAIAAGDMDTAVDINPNAVGIRIRNNGAVAITHMIAEFELDI